MLYLILQLGQERFALPTRQIVEVVPFVSLKPIPQAPEFVSGVFTFRGTLVPVVDLCRITSGQTSHAWLTTRIVIVQYPVSDNESRLLGLLVEQVNATCKISDDKFSRSGVELPNTPFLGEFAKLDDGLVQRVNTDDLLNDEVRALLFRECA